MAGTRAASAGLRRVSKRWPTSSSRVRPTSSQAPRLTSSMTWLRGIEDDDRLDDRVEQQTEAIGLAIEVGVLDGGRRARSQVLGEDQVLGSEPAARRGRCERQRPEDALAGPAAGRTCTSCSSSPRSSSRWWSSRATAIERFRRDVRRQDRLAGSHDLERSGRLVRVVRVLVEQLPNERDLGRIDVGDRERSGARPRHRAGRPRTNRRSAGTARSAR